ncbi:hypothetical protein OR573_07275 [Halomonas sp. CH40]
MYWDDTIIFGLVTVVLAVVFMVGWVAFIVRDHRRKKNSHTKVSTHSQPHGISH